LLFLIQNSGYRETGRFLDGNRRELQQSLRLLHYVPSHVTVRDVLQRIDFGKFAPAFNTRAIRYVSMCKGDTKAPDGKAIRSTAGNCGSSYQNFVGLTGIFASQRGTVPGCGKIENKKKSEIPKVHELIKALDVKGEIFTLDALQCKKNDRRNHFRWKSLHSSGQRQSKIIAPASTN
jgi:hypothetical protein